MFRKLDRILSHKYPRSVLGAAEVVSKAQSIVGAEAQVISYREGILKLRVSSSVQADKINSRRQALIEEINQRLKNIGKIDKIKFEL